MALKYDIVRFPLVGGLDTKSAGAATPPDKLQVLQNGEFTKTGSVRKRRGYTAVDDIVQTSVMSGALLGEPRAVMNRRDELLLATDEQIYSRDGVTNMWNPTGSYCPFTHTVNNAASSTKDQTLCDMARVNGVACYVWQDGPDSLKYSVVDENTGTVYVHAGTLASMNAVRPHVIVVGNSFMLTYAETSGNDLKIKIINSVNVVGTIGNAVASLSTDLNATRLYAVCESADGGEGFIAWHDGSNQLSVAQILTTGALARIMTVSTDVPEDIALAHSAELDQIDVVWVVATNGKHRAYTSGTMVAVAVAATEYTVANMARCAVAAVPRDASDGAAKFSRWYEITAASVSNHFVKNAAGDTQHAYIASAGFTLGNRGCVLLGHESRTGLQNAYYLYDNKSICLGTFANGSASVRRSITAKSSMSTHSIVVGDRRALDVDQYVAQFAHNMIQRVDFNTAPTVSSAQLGEAVYASGSQLWLYDGGAPVEAGFHMFPDMLVGGTCTMGDGGTVGDFTQRAAGNNLADTTQYNYRIYYEWYTAAGERVRSFALQRSVTTSIGSCEMEISIPTLSHTVKRALGARSEVSIVVYRSQGNLSQLFYRVSNPDPLSAGDNGYLVNDPTVAAVIFTDDMADVDLLDNEWDMESVLELKHIAVPAPERVLAVGPRLYLCGGAVPRGQVLPSKLTLDGDTAQFAGEFQTPVARDRIVDMGAIDSAVVCFTRDRIYSVGGDPDNTGGGDAFQSVNVTSDVGCTDAGSVVGLPQGLMFKSAKGIYGLNTGGVPAYVGAEVERYNTQTITDARVVPDTNQVVFLTDDGSTLMFDYQYGQWGVYTNHEGLSSAAVEGLYAYLRTTGDVFVQSTVYTDAGAAFTLKIRTGNLAMEAAQPFWRLRRAGILGEYKSPHKLRVGIYHGRDEFALEVAIWDPSTVLDVTLWGEGSDWGENAYWGAAQGTSDYQFLRRVAVQKCSQVRFEFEDIITEEAGASYELTELMLEVGLKTGMDRASEARKI
jgi:hypothetical protein